MNDEIQNPDGQGLDPDEVARFQRNATEWIIMKFTEFRGHQLFDIRTYFVDEETGKETPTKKGVTCNRRLIPDLLEAITGAHEAWLAAGGEEGDKAKSAALKEEREAAKAAKEAEKGEAKSD
jgi:hypothetical protein